MQDPHETHIIELMESGFIGQALVMINKVDAIASLNALAAAISNSPKIIAFHKEQALKAIHVRIAQLSQQNTQTQVTQKGTSIKFKR